MRKTAATQTAKRAPFKKKEGPTDVDVHVGQRIRQRRSVMGLTQEALASATGLTFQQIQKYEQGKNRVSASRLHQLAKLLDVDTNFFFDLLPEEKKGAATGLAEDQEEFHGKNMLSSRETMELIKTYYSIQDPKIRKNLLKIIRQMASNSSKK